tara:strand:- start:198 stop:629 length:432 start_codon:yes stop_codon:yes gene_type:complete
MIIGKFQMTDLDPMMEFLKANLTESYDSRVFYKIHQKWPDGFLIVKDSEKIMGVCCGAILPNEKLRILIIVLSMEYQGKGLGKKLLSTIIKESRNYGVKKVTLEVRKDSDAINFYRKFGFTGVDVLPCYYQDGCDGIVMELQL